MANSDRDSTWDHPILRSPSPDQPSIVFCCPTAPWLELVIELDFLIDCLGSFHFFPYNATDFSATMPPLFGLVLTSFTTLYRVFSRYALASLGLNLYASNSNPSYKFPVPWSTPGCGSRLGQVAGAELAQEVAPPPGSQRGGRRKGPSDIRRDGQTVKPSHVFFTDFKSQ